MTRLHEQTAFIRLEPLTPIHIGTGETMDPLSYIMKEEGGNPFLYSVDVPSWVEAHPDPAGLAGLFSTKPLPEIRAHLARELRPLVEVYGGAPVRVASREIYETYDRELASRDSANQLLIDPALKNPLTGALLVPGSSIKGAIRTAVIDWLDRNWKTNLKEAMNRDPRQGYGRALEELLGKVSENAFRNLKVGDFPAALGESVIVTAKEVRRRYNPNKQGTPKNPCEATLSLSMSGQSPALYGKIAVGAHDAGRRDTALTVSMRGREKAWTLRELMELCNEFYRERYSTERGAFYLQQHLDRSLAALKPVDAVMAEPGPDAMILRLGHYSHVECMTVTNNQPQTRRLKDGSFMPSGTTRTLADGIHPFGWARLSIVSAGEYAEACARREEHDAAFLAERVLRRHARLEEREAETRKRAEREQAERERQEAETRRQEELAAMTPEERLISAVESGGNENQAVELYGKLDGLDEPLRRKSAQALREFWEKAGKWEKKKCTDKQWVKVQKVRGILGDG